LKTYRMEILEDLVKMIERPENLVRDKNKSKTKTRIKIKINIKIKIKIKIIIKRIHSRTNLYSTQSMRKLNSLDQ
jgi:hypothetical protein